MAVAPKAPHNFWKNNWYIYELLLNFYTFFVGCWTFCKNVVFSRTEYDSVSICTHLLPKLMYFLKCVVLWYNRHSLDVIFWMYFPRLALCCLCVISHCIFYNFVLCESCTSFHVDTHGLTFQTIATKNYVQTKLFQGSIQFKVSDFCHKSSFNLIQFYP